MTELYPKILAAVAPTIVLAIIMIRRDRRSEPIGWLLAAVELGILCGPAVLLIGYLVLPDIPTDTFIGAFLSSFINAAIPEEAFKFAALYFLVERCKHFDEMFEELYMPSALEWDLLDLKTSSICSAQKMNGFQ